MEVLCSLHEKKNALNREKSLDGSIFDTNTTLRKINKKYDQVT